LALARLPDASLKETAAVAILLAVVISAVAQGIITAVDLAWWPPYHHLDVNTEIVAIPFTAFEKLAIEVFELVILPLFNLVLTIPAALLGVACAWLAAPWDRLWGAVRVGTATPPLRLVAGVAIAAGAALGVSQVLTDHTDPSS